MELPPDEVARLHGLQASRQLTALRLRVRLLREAGWTLQSIASSLSTYRSTVRAWEMHASRETSTGVRVPAAPSSGPELPTLAVDPADYPDITLPLIGIATLSPRLTASQATELRELSHWARRVRGHTAPHARARVSAARLDALLLHHRARGVTVEDLATATQLTSRSVRNRVPSPLPPQPELTTSSGSDTLLILWPAPSRTRKWRVFVDAVTRVPLAFPARLITLPVAARGAYYLLSPGEAERQLGWPAREGITFPLPRSLV